MFILSGLGVPGEGGAGLSSLWIPDVWLILYCFVGAKSVFLWVTSCIYLLNEFIMKISETVQRKITVFVIEKEALCKIKGLLQLPGERWGSLNNIHV